MSKRLGWKTLRRTYLLDRSPWLKVYEDQVALPDGEIVDGYLHMQTPGYAMIVPVNARKEIGLIRSYKRGVDGLDMQPPAGVLEDGEDPFDTAKRELLEETGCRANAWEKLGEFVLSGNYGAGNAYIYLATECTRIQEPDAGDLEEQEVIWLPTELVIDLYKKGRFQQMGAVAALGLAFARLGTSGVGANPDGADADE